MKPAPPMPVFLTVDTELWPAQPGWPDRALPAAHGDFAAEIAADVHGQTSAGGYGLPYQIGVLNRHRLRATYFVEALFAARAGIAPLAHIAGLVRRGGHEAQLHLHTEWLREIDAAALPPDLRADWPSRHCQYLSQLPLAQQSALIRLGLALLAEAGVPRVHAFRAGSYGGNLDTLRALAASGIAIDSSYNPCHLSGDWGGADLAQPQALAGVWEFPVSSLRDFPGHRRHAQLCACSTAELTRALPAARSAGWPAFVIVLHSFELIRKHGAGRLATPDRLNIGRFERLCAFLDQHRAQFPTRLFSELDPAALAAAPGVPAPPALRTRPLDTLQRVGQQAWSRFR